LRIRKSNQVLLKNFFKNLIFYSPCGAFFIAAYYCPPLGGNNKEALSPCIILKTGYIIYVDGD
tara:strand:+ start:981 stop:1169 length:189 start_codon:yes stop_codon:yes gene_type:complete